MTTPHETSGGSEQLRTYRRLRRHGSTMMTACAISGVSVGEARLIETEDQRNPPPPESYKPLKQSPAVIVPQQPKEVEMSRGSAKRAAEAVQEVVKPDFELAVKIYRNDIKPAQSKVGEYAQEQSTAFKAIKKRAHIQPQAAKMAFKLDDMEESKRDDFLRSLNGLLKALNITMPADLVDAAEGKAKLGENVIPVGKRRRPQLATVPVPVSDGVDADLADEDDDEGDEGEGFDDEEHAEAAE